MNRRRLLIALLVVTGASVFGAGINWGLPSRASDPFLLGKNYHGLRLEALTSQAPEVDANPAADVVAPVAPADQIVPLSDTDAKKAQILCRYRLYSEQPDEMITFRSLSRMKPGELDLDPRLYQYGGLWIYPVGAIIKAGGLLGWLEISTRQVYIENPRIFGEFYVAARAYCALWGLIGVWAVFVLTQRLIGSNEQPKHTIMPAIAALCFISMPVVVNMAHEAKPHLPATVLILLAVLAGDNYLRQRKLKWAALTGALCGAAAGMALWGAVGLVIAPMLRRPRAIALAIGAALLIYGLTNPYVVYHLLRDPATLKSNLGNTAAMYQVGRPVQAALNALRLALAGCGGAVFLAGCAGGILLLRRRTNTSAVGTLLAAAAIATAVPFIAMAQSKPGEYARFALLPDVALAIAAAAAIARLKTNALTRAVAASLLLALTAAQGAFYEAGFIKDAAATPTSRIRQAQTLQAMLDSRPASQGRPTLGVYADPAPYCLPPVDLDAWNIVRLPKSLDPAHAAGLADVIVRPRESSGSLLWSIGPTPISWADKQFDVFINQTTAPNP